MTPTRLNASINKSPIKNPGYTIRASDPWASVEYAGDSIELNQVNCPSEKTNFEMNVGITFKVDNLTPEDPDMELDVLETALVEAYNSVNTFNGKICDLQFRGATSATLIQVEEDLDANRTIYKAVVGGICRGCSVNTGLFDPDRRRHLLIAAKSANILAAGNCRKKDVSVQLVIPKSAAQLRRNL